MIENRERNTAPPTETDVPDYWDLAVSEQLIGSEPTVYGRVDARFEQIVAEEVAQLLPVVEQIQKQVPETSGEEEDARFSDSFYFDISKDLWPDFPLSILLSSLEEPEEYWGKIFAGTVRAIYEAMYGGSLDKKQEIMATRVGSLFIGIERGLFKAIIIGIAKNDIETTAEQPVEQTAV